MRNYLINCFHVTIIAFVVLSFVGCGYKTAPVYVPKDKVEKDAK
jgi:predicted small lipoprotein YifL